MFTYELTYEDFNDPPQKVTEKFYFNLSKPELIKLQANIPGGMQKLLQEIIDAKDSVRIALEFDKLLLAAYGIREEDGRHFTKSDELRAKFESSAAYAEIFSKLISDDKFAAAFVVAVFPKDMGLQQEVDKLTTNNPAFPPTPVQELPTT